jgi:hypothetical protein
MVSMVTSLHFSNQFIESKTIIHQILAQNQPNLSSVCIYVSIQLCTMIHDILVVILKMVGIYSFSAGCHGNHFNEQKSLFLRDIRCPHLLLTGRKIQCLQCKVTVSVTYWNSLGRKCIFLLNTNNQ